MKRRINKIQDETKKEDVYQKMLRGRSYFAEYSLSEKGELVLADANREYLSANGYTAEQIGQCIAAFAPPAFQAQLQSYLRKNGSYVFWEECRSGMRKVRVGVENGRVTMTGHYMLPDENKAYAGVGCGEQGHYYIFDLNDSFTELLKGERLVFRSLTSSSCFCRAMITLSACVYATDWNGLGHINDEMSSIPYGSHDSSTTDPIYDPSGNLDHNSLNYKVFEEYGPLLLVLAMLMFGAMVGGICVARETAVISFWAILPSIRASAAATDASIRLWKAKGSASSNNL